MEIGLVAPSVEDVAGLEGGQLDDALRSLNRVLGEVEASIAAVMQRCRRSGAFLDDGFRTVASWAAAQCNWPIAEARSRSRLAAALAELPATATALSAGVIGVAQAREIAGFYANPRARPHVAGAEAVLLADAAEAPFAEFAATCRRFAELVDEDGAHHRYEAAHAARQASTVTVGEEFFLRANGATVAGAEIAEILDRFTEAEFAADCAAVHAEDGVDGVGLPRTHRQRRFDALVAVFRAAAANVPGLSREPQVVIHTDVRTYGEAFARFFDLTPHGPDVGSWRGRFCESADGVPIDPLQAVAASLVGTIRRVVVDSGGLVVDYGRSRRLFTGAVRDAVRASGRRCLWPGCDVPGGRCQIDHSQPWTAYDGSPGGTTSAGNGGLLCAHHNRFKNRGYSTVRDADGRWHVLRPDAPRSLPEVASP